LNFGIGEQIRKEKLVQIAAMYMEKIGFENQPYLVYQHLDAGHPHIHIVSTNIQEGEKRISLHNLGKLKSNVARQEIELAYNLKRAEVSRAVEKEMSPLAARRLAYGKG
jgi:uncharacterized protein YijF (DUF1287 family)